MTKRFCKAFALILFFSALLFSFGGCEMFFNSDADYTLVEVDEFFDVDTFFANCQNNSFVIAPSQDGNFKLTYYRAEYYPLNHKTEGKTLSLEGEYSKPSVGNVSSKIATVTLFVPQNFSGDIYITTSNGGVSLQNLSLGVVDIETSNGKVKLTECELIEADINTRNGKIELSGVSAEGKIELISSNGALQLTNIAAASLYGRTGNGKVSLKEIDCADIEMDTSNGSITADILGEAKDYTIFVSTSNGGIYLQGGKIKKGTTGSGEKNIKFTTSNGKIEIHFSQK